MGHKIFDSQRAIRKGHPPGADILCENWSMCGELLSCLVSFICNTYHEMIAWLCVGEGIGSVGGKGVDGVRAEDDMLYTQGSYALRLLCRQRIS